MGMVGAAPVSATHLKLIGPSAPRLDPGTFGEYDAYVVGNVAAVLEVGRHSYRGTTVRGRTFTFTLDMNAARTKITYVSAGRPVNRIAWIANDLDGNDLLWWSGNAPKGFVIQDENGSVIEKLEFGISASLTASGSASQPFSRGAGAAARRSLPSPACRCR